MNLIKIREDDYFNLDNVERIRLRNSKITIDSREGVFIIDDLSNEEVDELFDKLKILEKKTFAVEVVVSQAGKGWHGPN